MAKNKRNKYLQGNSPTNKMWQVQLARGAPLSLPSSGGRRGKDSRRSLSLFHFFYISGHKILQKPKTVSNRIMLQCLTARYQPMEEEEEMVGGLEEGGKTSDSDSFSSDPRLSRQSPPTQVCSHSACCQFSILLM